MPLPDPRSVNRNILVMGLSFLLLFTAFQTSASIQTLVLDGAMHQGNGLTSQSGYYSAAILYASAAICNLAGSPLVGRVGPKRAMILSALAYLLFMVAFFKPVAWFIYLCSALLGVGAAVLWPAQGAYLTLISDERNSGRNASVFWGMFQCSSLVGGLIVYFQFAGKTDIDQHTRVKVYGAFTALAVAGIACMLVLQKPERLSTTTTRYSSGFTFTAADRQELKENFLRPFQLLKTRSMLLLVCSFVFTGLELCFWSGVYPTALGRTQAFGDNAKAITGLSAICAGAGQVVASLLLGGLSKITKRTDRNMFVLLGYVAGTVNWFLILLNIPWQACLHETPNHAYLHPPSLPLALCCSLLLGFADGCWNTQIYSLLASLFPKDGHAAFAMFKLWQVPCVAIAYGYSSALAMHWQLVILCFSSTAAVLTFFQAEWHRQRSQVPTILVQDSSTLPQSHVPVSVHE